MCPSSNIEELQHKRDALRTITASQDWAKSYRKDRKTFKYIVRVQAKIERNVAAYFRELSERVDSYIDWGKYSDEIAKKQADFEVFTRENADINSEEALILKVVFDDINTALEIGAEAGRNRYQMPHAPNKLRNEIDHAARNNTAELVKGVNNTTKDLISKTVQKSIDLGEPIKEARKRVQDVIKDPGYDSALQRKVQTRAERIARTEAVRSYTDGIISFGKASGAETKEWELEGNPCPVCIAIAGEGPIPLEQNFADPGGSGPPAHTNCQCGTKLNYPERPEDQRDGLIDDTLE